VSNYTNELDEMICIQNQKLDRAKRISRIRIKKFLKAIKNKLCNTQEQ